ncbi:hypothetical protein Hypma_004890 [Hypsizygus marmoreus]|uniref:Major facilitator superfamily (MFS) profile domain-containing protein n=1 Tax=Hypsizygus marmoreus TaxID=39966 RepID=A0A369KGI9_HYPMA|nr:hypothetical protein Hypma_004890 [Hypsizygus marmoreus]
MPNLRCVSLCDVNFVMHWLIQTNSFTPQTYSIHLQGINDSMLGTLIDGEWSEGGEEKQFGQRVFIRRQTNVRLLTSPSTSTTMVGTFRDRIKSISLIFACGTALFSDGYANGVIGSVNTILTRIYGKDALKSHNYSTVVNSLGFAGIVVGMLLFGYLSDKVGRKFGMMSAAGIVVVFSGLSAASSGANGRVGGLLNMLSTMRFFLGIGVGAEYPCGSVSASEQSEENGIRKGTWHRWLALSTNTMIDFGFVIAAFTPLVLFWIFGPDHLRAVWRLSLGLGIVPALAVFIWRLNMDEPVRYKKDSMQNVRIPYRLILRRYGRSLAAISFVWFLYDMIVYPFGIYSSTIVNNITGGSTDLSVVFGWNVIINLFYMPGTIIGAFAIDYLGPRYTLIIGLVLQAVIGCFMSGFYSKLTNHISAFAVVYGIFLSFGEFGPGNCTFILASKSCPTAVRGQFFGVAAAVGKVGAFVGTWMFPPIIDAFGGPDTLRGNTGPFWIGSGLAIASALVTLAFIRPLTSDGMAREDREFREYLEVHGYDTSQMGLHIVEYDSSTILDDPTEAEKQDLNDSEERGRSR